MPENTDSLREYESVFICPVDLTEAAMDSLLARFQKAVTDARGSLGTVEKWGRRKLSYPIRRQREGFYIYWTFNAPPTVAKELDHLYHVTDGVLRHLVVRHVKFVAPKAPPPAPSATAAVPAESAPPPHLKVVGPSR
jgi:small subunit ribosomal protein S6